MLVDISVIPGKLNKGIKRKREITPIFKEILSTLRSQNGKAHLEIIVHVSNGAEILRRVYPDPEIPNETPEHFCLRIQKEICKLI